MPSKPTRKRVSKPDAIRSLEVCYTAANARACVIRLFRPQVRFDLAEGFILTGEQRVRGSFVKRSIPAHDILNWEEVWRAVPPPQDMTTGEHLPTGKD